jgi:protocatechuate 3,4-dioxygenase beta subunit
MSAPPIFHDDFDGRTRGPTMDRRQSLRAFAGVLAGATLLSACRNDDGAATTTGTATPVSGDDAACSRITPQEPNGPFWADGSNGPNILAEAGVVRQDIRRSIGSASGTAQGVPLTMTLQVLDAANGCMPYASAAVYAWHCTADGSYSMYDDSVVDENFLRGVQVADADGFLTFTTIFPGCYPGRWPHVHFEVYPTLDEALASGYPVKMSQVAFPKEASEQAYTSSGYEASADNLSPLAIETDILFSEAGTDNRADDIRRRDAGIPPVPGWADQMASVSGDATTGYTATFAVRV